jgi:hypothetical protein
VLVVIQQRRGRLDLRSLAQIDLEKVVRDVDIDTLQVSCLPHTPPIDLITFLIFVNIVILLYADELGKYLFL